MGIYFLTSFTMYKNIIIPHNPRVPAKYSMALTSYDILDYHIFYNKIIWLADYYRSTNYEMVLIEFGINRSGQQWKFYARLYMNDSEKVPIEVGTIIPTLWNIIETEELLSFKQRIHE